MRVVVQFEVAPPAPACRGASRRLSCGILPTLLVAIKNVSSPPLAGIREQRRSTLTLCKLLATNKSLKLRQPVWQIIATHQQRGISADRQLTAPPCQDRRRSASRTVARKRRGDPSPPTRSRPWLPSEARHCSLGHSQDFCPPYADSRPRWPSTHADLALLPLRPCSLPAAAPGHPLIATHQITSPH